MNKFIPGLLEALEYSGGTHTLADIADRIESGDAQLWIEEEACIVTEVHDLPRKKVLHYWLATGNLDTVVALSNRVFEWGKSIGCEGATLAGRRGWERVLKSEGWRPLLTVMGREM